MRSHGNCKRIGKIFACEIRNPENFSCGIWNPGIFLVESEILGFGVRNKAQLIRTLVMIGIRNPLKFHWQKIRNPESKTVLDYLTWGDTIISQHDFSYFLILFLFSGHIPEAAFAKQWVVLSTSFLDVMKRSNLWCLIRWIKLQQICTWLTVIEIGTAWTLH